MAKVDKQEQVKELLKRAEDGARAVFESDRYRNYLKTMSKFHNYSFRNTLLIYLQKPQASYVAGYVAWQKNFKRQVQKGEKGIQIVGYTPKNVMQEQEKKDAQGNVIHGSDGRPETETVTRKIPYFAPMYVYDVSQTEGEPLPRLVNELDGSVEAYQDLMTALREVSPFPIVFEDIHGGANGYCSPTDQKIAIRQGMSEAQTVKTTIHEITHADLHAPEIDLAIGDKKDRRTKEVEAESTAFIVCNHYGIDSSNYTFGYLATWSSTKELTELQNSLDTIQKQANELIDRIDTRLIELQKDRSTEITNPAIPDKSVTVEEMQQYGYTDKSMLPLDTARATELFNENNPVYLLYSDNTKAAAETAEDIRSHTEKGGLCGLEPGDFSRVRASEIAARYDTLVGTGDARQTYPFSIDNPQERIIKITARVQELDFASLDRVIDYSIAAAADGADKAAAIRDFTQLKDDCNAYRTDKMKELLSEYGGEPIVVVRWSENPALSSGQVFSLHEANSIFRDFDAKYPDDMGYEKTAFTLIYDKDGEVSGYEGRQDFGDREGGVIDHIKSFWENELSPTLVSQHLAAGNTELIDNAKEAVTDFIPYLTAHDALGRLEDEAKTNLGHYEFMKEQGIPLTDHEKLVEYTAAMIDYVGAARASLNNGTEAPTMPQQQANKPSLTIDDFEHENYGHKTESGNNYAGDVERRGSFRVGDRVIYNAGFNNTSPSLGIVTNISNDHQVWRGTVDNRGEHSEEFSQRLTVELTDGRIITNEPYIRFAAANTINLQKRDGIPPVSKEAIAAAQQMATIRKEYTAEAKDLGITVNAYAGNDFDAPAGRTFAIYQMKSGDETRDYRFEGLNRLEQQGITPALSMYDKVYEGALPATATLSNVFEQFNIEHPANFTGHSLSVSDIIVIEYKGEITANYVDRYGFQHIPELAQEIAADRQPAPALPLSEVEQWENDHITDFTATTQTVKSPIVAPPEPPVVGEISFASGEKEQFTDSAKYLAAIKEELPYISTTGFSYKTLTKDPKTRKSIDDMLYDMYGENNPHTIDHYADSIKHDNDIDLDREKTREQLGFPDKPEEMNLADRFKAARTEADRRNGEADRQNLEQQNNEREER